LADVKTLVGNFYRLTAAASNDPSTAYRNSILVTNTFARARTRAAFHGQQSICRFYNCDRRRSDSRLKRKTFATQTSTRFSQPASWSRANV